MSLSVEMLIALHGPKGCTLKADRAMLDPIMKLEVDCSEIQ
jgi:hypothetical protein